jgi:hypothetical protein
MDILKMGNEVFIPIINFLIKPQILNKFNPFNYKNNPVNVYETKPR